MKYEGIVIKLTKNRAIVSTDDLQCFYIKRRSTIYVGKNVEFTKNDIISKKPIQTKLLLSVACILIIITFVLNFKDILNINDILSKSKVFAYIDVDINPSIELKIDKEGMVLDIVPLNEDAKILTKKIEVDRVEVFKVIDEIIYEVENSGAIIESEKQYILVSSTLNSKIDETANEYQAENEKLDTIMNSIKKNIEENKELNVYIVRTNMSERKYAKSEGISSGRYKLFNEVKGQINNFSIEEAKKVSVNELLKEVLNKKIDDSIDAIPSPTPSPLRVEDTAQNISATPTEIIKNGEVTGTTSSPTSPTPTSPTPTSPTPTSPTPTSPTPTSPTPTSPTPQTPTPPTQTPTQKPTPISIPILTPTQIPTSTNRITNSVYMKFESYNYPGQFIQHKIHFEAYISANGILPDDCTFKIVPGLADPNCISFESKNFPGFYLKNENFKIVLKPFDGSKDFNENVTFRKVPGLADEKLTSFQSFVYPNRYIRHANYILQIDEIVSSNDKEDATYKGIEVESISQNN